MLSQEEVNVLLSPNSVDEKPSNIGECLDKAKTIINGDRLQEYGNPKQNFERIQRYWNIYLTNKGFDKYLTTKDVAMMMLLLKVARLDNKFSEDSCVDIAGYIGLYEYLNKN